LFGYVCDIGRFHFSVNVKDVSAVEKIVKKIYSEWSNSKAWYNDEKQKNDVMKLKDILWHTDLLVNAINDESEHNRMINRDVHDEVATDDEQPVREKKEKKTTHTHKQKKKKEK
jgi:hypothetical protein